MFKEGEVYEEGEHYEIKGAGDWKWCTQLNGNIFASAITVKTEDELRKEALGVFTDCRLRKNSFEESIKTLHQKYIITKINQLWQKNG